MDTWVLVKKPKIYDEKKKKSLSTNGSCLAGCRYVEECKSINTYHPA